ncbi:DNA topoisomerase 2-like isoform X2 [Miscanthus floridulus]|uniref:DNA topoisomerase 2-like isoform X2 n=1 Tax=Miscanthus floridulus TaxID=154761 RepID=UPI00345AFBBA
MKLESKLTLTMVLSSCTTTEAASLSFVNIHKEDIYRPEAVFSSYRTNKYKDVVVANILSTLCIVQTYDGYKKYKQIFFENMVKRKKAEISNWKDRNKWTSITFKPDLAKFGMSKLDDDIVGLMRKRVVDFAGLLSNTVTVKLDGEKLHVNSFLKYVDLYIHSASKDIPQAPPGYMRL